MPRSSTCAIPASPASPSSPVGASPACRSGRGAASVSMPQISKMFSSMTKAALAEAQVTHSDVSSPPRAPLIRSSLPHIPTLILIQFGVTGTRVTRKASDQAATGRVLEVTSLITHPAADGSSVPTDPASLTPLPVPSVGSRISGRFLSPLPAAGWHGGARLWQA